METVVQSCPYCSYPIIEAFYFCPNCGKSLKPQPISVFKQIGIYLISILLPPLGLWPGIKYLRQKNKKAKIIGLIAIILTLVSVGLTIWFSIGLFNQITQSFAGQTNLNQFNELGL
jgi:hypothetical protein